jgi:hypothetical protein
MKVGTTNRKQTMMAAVLGVLALGACIYLYEELFATDTPSPASQPTVVTAPAAPVAAPASNAKGNAGKASATLDPTLHMEAMLVSESVVYSGTGRNIFSASSAPPPMAIPKPVSTARIAPPPPPVRCPPNCPPPPPPPPIDLKFFGVETGANGTKQACLLHGDNVYLAVPGDVVLRRYKILAVDAKTIQVEDLQNNNKQTLPLLAN